MNIGKVGLENCEYCFIRLGPCGHLISGWHFLLFFCVLDKYVFDPFEFCCLKQKIFDIIGI